MPELPRRFGHYDLIQELGRGAQGVVYVAEDLNLKRQVALKMLLAAGAHSTEAHARFQREAALTSRIHHAGICGVYEVGEADGVPYIAMQLVRGTTLADLLGRSQQAQSKGKSAEVSFTGAGGKSELQDVMQLVERAARALHAAHEVGLVHRDIKPANIMVTPAGDPVLLDFGLARDVDAEGAGLTQSGQIMGTPAYLAPEQILAERGGVDRRTDVYGLGVTLFECLTLKRPYDGKSFDQLFHQILAGNLTNPRKLNPRIPQDLRTVIEVAMDRDRNRRYATAEAFADDLRRVRSYEPIQASAAGLVTRVIKWSRRHPGRAASACSAVLLALIGGGGTIGLEWQRRAAVRDNLAQAEAQLAAADHGAALASVARALERDPESLRARELKAAVEQAQAEAAREVRRQASLAMAGEARAESLTAQQRYGELQQRIEGERTELAALRTRLFGEYADESSRAAFAARESALRDLDVEAQQLLIAAQEALERAVRSEQEWGGPSAVTEAVRASFFLGRWREAEAHKETASAAAFRAAVEHHDAAGEHRAELLGRGTLEIAVEPADATVHLFRYESSETVRPGVIPRLVPVPTRGIGRVLADGLGADFLPGDACLAIVAVAEGSPAASAGLQAGDLVIAIEHRSCGRGLFVREVPPVLQAAGIAPYARIEALDGRRVEDGFDWTNLPAGEQEQIAFAGHDGAVACTRDLVPVCSPAELAAQAGAADLHLRCLHAGGLVELTVPSGHASGLTTEVTAYPLIQGADNKVTAGAAFEVDPGSYLLWVVRDGMEPQRYPVVVDRGAAARASMRLLPAGSTPADYVWVPPGPTRLGGDPEAYRSRPLRQIEIDGFFLARQEVTNRQYYEFLDDPEVRQRIETSPVLVLVPRDTDGKVLAERQADGTWTWKVYTHTTADSPVLGVSWNDVHEYLAWRNHQAGAAGEPWIYDLPGRDQWERAARGADGRPFPWGDRFDPSLTVSRYRKFDWLLDAAGGFERCDESPFGILDLGGSREEWTGDVASRTKSGAEIQYTYYKCGGHWQIGAEIAFRTTSLAEAGAPRAASSQGFRLLIRRR